MSLTILTHTHSECQDVYPMYFDSINKYLRSGFDLKHHVVVNKQIENTEFKIDSQHIYDESMTFSQRLLLGLREIDTEFVLFMLEDFVLYDTADFGILNQILYYMEKDKDVSFTRLVDSGAQFVNNSQIYNDEMFEIFQNETYFFSNQATIWRKEILERLYSSFNVLTPQYEVETSPELRKIARKGMCVRKRKNSQISHKRDSLVFPYIAAAIIRKQWNISEYPNLFTLCKQYNIDPNIRGVC